MSNDDPLKKLMESQDALRKIVSPASDALRDLGRVTDSHRMLGFETATLRDLEAFSEHSRLLDFTRDLHLSAFDTTGLASLAAAAVSHRKLLAGPLADYGKLAEFVSPLAAGLEDAVSSYKLFESQFRLPDLIESTRFAHESIASASNVMKLLGVEFESSLKSAMISMDTPWLRLGQLTESVHAFSELQSLGAAINVRRPYEEALSNALRGALGDWREVTTLPSTIYGDPVIRSDFYVSLGFDSSLTDFTAQAFDESMSLAGLDATEDAQEGDHQQPGLARNIRAYRDLFKLEREIRDFIDRAMKRVFGVDWPRQQIPDDMLNDWKAKRQVALKKGEEEQPLIAYADFTDYIRIIERKDNWAKVFQSVFGRPSDVQESFTRLFPVRICTMHARIITLDDELFLRAESRRILRAIKGAALQ
jgi:Swt1-like HEPN